MKLAEKNPQLEIGRAVVLLHHVRRSPSLGEKRADCAPADSRAALAPYATLAPGSIESSSERGSMARKRYQKGHVYLDGDKWKGRYRDDVLTDHGTRRIRREVTLGTKKELPTKRLAERRMEVFLARVNGLSYRPGKVATFEEFIERWKTEVLTKQKASSACAVRWHLRCYILPQLGKLRLEQLSTENQQTFVTRMTETGISRKSILNVLGTLSSVITTAESWGYTCEPVSTKKLYLPQRGVRFEARHFTTEQLRKIFMLAEEPWRTLFCVVTLDGLRAGEALGVQWDDVDLDRKLLHIRRSAWCGKVQTAKSQASETVLPIPEALAVILGKYRAQWRPNPSGFLFATRNDRPPSSNKVVEYHLWTILDALGIPRCGLHAFRHTHAALLLDSGATPKVAQRQLRHSDARTTLEIYGHVVGDAHREAVEKVAAIVDANGRHGGTVN
jgi:integrase